MKSETKIKFIVQYFNQKVCIISSDQEKTDDIVYVVNNATVMYVLNEITYKVHLELRPIKSLTFEEIEKLMYGHHLIEYHMFAPYQKILEWRDGNIKEAQESISKEAFSLIHEYLLKNVLLYQWFVQNGFAVPYYDGIEDKVYTIEQLIKENVIKIKS